MGCGVASARQVRRLAAFPGVAGQAASPYCSQHGLRTGFFPARGLQSPAAGGASGLVKRIGHWGTPTAEAGPQPSCPRNTWHGRGVDQKHGVAVATPPMRGDVRPNLEQLFRTAYPRVVVAAARVLGFRDEAEEVAHWRPPESTHCARWRKATRRPAPAVRRCRWPPSRNVGARSWRTRVAPRPARCHSPQASTRRLRGA